jgi:hypothetical protein
VSFLSCVYALFQEAGSSNHMTANDGIHSGYFYAENNVKNKKVDSARPD